MAGGSCDLKVIQKQNLSTAQHALLLGYFFKSKLFCTNYSFIEWNDSNLPDVYLLPCTRQSKVPNEWLEEFLLNRNNFLLSIDAQKPFKSRLLSCYSRQLQLLSGME